MPCNPPTAEPKRCHKVVIVEANGIKPDSNANEQLNSCSSKGDTKQQNRVPAREHWSVVYHLPLPPQLLWPLL